MRFFGKRHTETSDEQLMVSLGRGSHSALDELYARYSRRLWFYCLKMLGDAHRAEDLVQDVFLMLIERPERFDASRRFSTWMFSCAHNACKNEYRRRQTRSESDADFDETPDADSAPLLDDHDRAEFRRLLDAELDAIGFEHRSVFVMRHAEDMTIKEIADAAGIPEGTVKSRLFNATKRLASRLKMFSPAL
jgi:RNA polymerase sigma-70 factor (ECF subfamily)